MGHVWVPSGAKARAAANLAAIDTLEALTAEARPATPAEQDVLAGWSSWGALPKVFDETADEWATIRGDLRARMDEKAWAAAAATTINAHYTDPVVVGVVWRALDRLGFAGGRVLEPGCGSGTFIGAAPSDAEMVGVELDPTTARIARLLYPSADIRAEGFETTRVPDGSFVAAVGNVPFGKLTLHDPTHNRRGHSIHNHFIIKSLRLCAPGGMVAVVTSRYTMDATNPAARREMAELADLVGAVRLPTGTMRRVAGTEVVCDLLVLRRREEGRDADPSRWDRTVEVATDGGPVRVNEYFAAHPEMVCGTMTVARGMYRDGDLVVTAELDELPARLRLATDHLVVSATERGLTFTARPGDEARPTATVDPSTIRANRTPKIGSIVETEVGFAQLGVDGFANLDVPKSRRGELSELLGLRDVTLDLLDAQAAGQPTEVSDVLRAELNRRYDAYVSRHGPVSRWRWSTPAKEGGRPRKIVPRLGGFRSDPDFATVMALEDFDVDDQVARKMPIFTRDVLQSVVTRLGADTPADALAITIAETGRVDLDRIADLLGVEAPEARAGLEGLVFDDPPTGETVTAAEYLSGDVRTKLDVARAHTTEDDRWNANVEALTAVQPRDLVAGEITVRPGVAWIPPEDVERFVVEVLGIPATSVAVRRLASTGTWELEVDSWAKRNAVCTAQFGTAERSAVDLLAAVMNQRAVHVYRTSPDGSRTLLADETALARERQESLLNRFGEWVWVDPDRRDRLVADYNRRFNSHVPRSYDGSHLSLPGLSTAFAPRDHQLAAVARIVAEPTVLLDHAVGAGKTGTMVMAGMEMRRLGLVRQPWYVVPNHMLEQFAAEFKQWYPAAKVLVGRDLSARTRREFVARTATGDWDGVVITQSAFGMLGVSESVLRRYLDAQVARFEAEKLAVASSRSSVKKLEAAKKQLEQRLLAKIDQARKDNGVSFDRSGCDYLFVDEAHHFKNLSVATSIQELAVSGSDKASDLEMKLGWLRRRTGGRCATFATGTPVANSMREMFVMQRYLRPADLEAAGVEHFDAWASQFCASKTMLELAPSGASHRVATRIAAFVNTPELVSMYRRFSDVMLPADLDLPIPDLAGGARRTRIVEPSEQLRAYIDDLGERAKAIQERRVTPEEDNMLKVTGDGRLAALDPRCVGMDRDPEGGKVAAIGAEVLRIWHANTGNAYLDSFGEPGKRPGAFQIVFCDRSMPKPGEWNFYDELRRHLIAGGIPADQVRFVHDAGNDRKKKEELFAACRDGRVAVLIGSTERMGVGTNIQARAVALHHADCPWRPADLEQREGRILRQGNQNPEVEILAYATEGSFDVYMWQLLERKARFIGQVRAGDLTARTVDDLGDEQSLSYAEIKALASGNPLVLERATVEAEVVRLERLRTMHGAEQSRIQSKLVALAREQKKLQRDIEAAETGASRVVDTQGDRFAATIRGRHLTDRREVGVEIQHALADAFTEQQMRRGTNEVIGTLGGTDVRIHAEATWDIAQIELVDLPLRPLAYDRAELRNSDALGLTRQLEHRLHSLGSVLEGAQDRLTVIDQEATNLRTLADRPFDGAAPLAQARDRLTRIDSALASSEREPSGREDSTINVCEKVRSRSVPSSKMPLATSALLPRPEHVKVPTARVLDE